MSRAREFNTPIDRAVRATRITRREFARQAWVAESTLYKARALDPNRGKIHWTTVVMIGTRMGIFHLGEGVLDDDPRIAHLVDNLVGKRGRGAARWDEFLGIGVHRRHLRLVS